MKINNICNKFKQHFLCGGLFYAIRRGIKYLMFISRKKVSPQKDCFISSGPLRLLLHNHGIQVFWFDKQITVGSGLSVGVNTLGLWTDSSKSDWQLLEGSADFFKIRISFNDIPLVQLWKISIHNQNRIIWEIESQNTEWLHIDELRIVHLLSSAYTSWFCGYKQGVFSRFGKEWWDYELNQSSSQLTGVRFSKEDTGLPALSFEITDKDSKIIIQNSSYQEGLRVVGFRFVNQDDRFDLGSDACQKFSVSMQIFEDASKLDSKIEFSRRNDLRTVLKEKNLTYINKHAKILLVNLPWHKADIRGVRAGSRWPHIKDPGEGKYMPFPFFLSQATALLKKNKIEAQIIDAIAEGLAKDDFIERLLGQDIDYLVAETSVPSFFQDIEMLKEISILGIKIILCGPNSLIYQADFMCQYQFIDFVLIGEYEFTLLDLIKALENKSDVSQVAGMLYKNGSKFVSTGPRGLCSLDSLPWPHRESLPMSEYWDLPGDIPYPSVQMLASRGCPFSCSFCLWPQVMYKGNSYRVRNTEDVINEMEYLIKSMGFKSVYFDDDTFNIGKERMLEFCHKLQLRGLSNIPWAIMARADMMDEQILLAMKKSGLTAVKYGVETFNPEFISECQKGLDISKAEEMIRFTKKLGIKVHLTFTFGFSGETKKTIKETIERGLKLDPDSVQFSVLTPFPGTRLFDQLDSRGKILTYDWDKYDGNSQCVFESESIKPEELLEARKYAYLLWGNHQRKKRGFLGDLNKFRNMLKLRGAGFTLGKTFNYMRFLLVKKIKYLNGKY